MSSVSDDRVGDHSTQVIGPIEQFEDLEMHDVDNLGQDHLQPARTEMVQNVERVVKRELVSDGSRSDETDDSGDGSDPTNEATGAEIGRSGKMNAEDEIEPSQGHVPPSYQKPVRSDSEYSTDDTDSSNLTESQVEDDSNLDDVASNGIRKSRKRKTPTDGPETQDVDGAADAHPTKKTKAILNRGYLDLLNQDINDTTYYYVSPVHQKVDERTALPSSQVGTSIWTTLEKERFFEALGRLGRDNAAAIAGRIHTKGEMEVRQYLKLLQDACTHRRQQNELDPLALEDFPAAVELSQDCCEALEEVADIIVRRQERSEIAAEEKECGPDWLLSQDNRKELEQQAENDTSRPISVFRAQEWLSLSEHFFMNAHTPEGNWQSVNGETPAIWLTALGDFHSLVLTLTKRLVAASNYMASTRIRSERGYRPQVRDFVKEKDVRAAVMSLGIAAQKPPLTRCVRRLGISVYEHTPKPDEERNMGSMSITDVEDALDIEGPGSANHLGRQMERIALSSGESSISSNSPEESDAQSKADNSDSSHDAASEEEEEIRAEASEVIFYSAVDPPQTKRDRQALHRRIRAEREQERYADAADAQASYEEELQMWSVLGQPPPASLTSPERLPPRRKLHLTVDIGYTGTVGQVWRAKTKVVSEWETQYLDTS